MPRQLGVGGIAQHLRAADHDRRLSGPTASACSSLSASSSRSTSTHWYGIRLRARNSRSRRASCGEPRADELDARAGDRSGSNAVARNARRIRSLSSSSSETTSRRRLCRHLDHLAGVADDRAQVGRRSRQQVELAEEPMLSVHGDHAVLVRRSPGRSPPRRTRPRRSRSRRHPPGTGRRRRWCCRTVPSARSLARCSSSRRGNAPWRSAGSSRPSPSGSFIAVRRTKPTSSTKHHDQSSPRSIDVMIGWPTLVRVARGVPVGRRVTAADLPARPADAQMHPGAADLQAFLAAFDLLGPSDQDLIEVCAVGHLRSPCSRFGCRRRPLGGSERLPCTLPKLSSPRRHEPPGAHVYSGSRPP